MQLPDTGSGRKGGLALLALGAAGSVLGILAMLFATTLEPGKLWSETLISRVAAPIVAIAFVTFYVGLLRAVFGDSLLEKIQSEEEDSLTALELAAILIPFFLLLLGLMPLMAILGKR